MANSMTRKKAAKAAAKYGRISSAKFVELGKQSKKAQTEYAKSNRVMSGTDMHSDLFADKRKFSKTRDRQAVKAALKIV